MSRYKSSEVIHGMLTERTVQTSRNTPPTFSPQESVYVTDVTGEERKMVPRVKVNPKQADGYRTPSSYYLSSGARVGGETAYSSNNTVTGATVIAKPYKTINPYDIVEGWLEGDTVVRLQPGYPSSTWALEQEVRMKILNNIKDQAFDAAMVLAEIGKTANTAANLMLRIGRSMNAISKRSPESFRWLMHGKMGVDNRRPSDRFLRETAGIFLEWKYGIMPTVYDLEAITKSLDMQQDGSLFDRPPLMVARAHVSRTESLDCGYIVRNPMTKHETYQCNLKTDINSRADFTVSGDGMRSLSQYGIGLTTLPTILYDKTPFSFVANMVVPMAEIISAWGALAGVTLRGYTETKYRTYNFPAQTLSGNYRSFGTVKVRTKPRTLTTFTRSGGSSIPMPLPFIRNPVKVGNVQTVLALFTQMRARPKRQPKIIGFDNKDL